MAEKKYKSPNHKLLNFFEESRDGWKKKALERQDVNRDLEARVRDLEKKSKPLENKSKK